MEKENKTRNSSEKQTLFKQSLNLSNYQSQSNFSGKLKKENRLKTQASNETEGFDVKKHFKFLKQNHACFQELNYKNQNPIKNSYLCRQNVPVSQKQRISCPLIEQLERKSSIRKLDIKILKKQGNPKKSIDTYWAVKQASSKLKNWNR